MKSLQLMPRGVAALLVVVTPLLAQPVVTLSPSAAPDRTPAALAPRPESNPSLAALRPPPRVAPFQSGPFALRPHASFSYVHSDGLLVQPGEQLTTSIYSVSAGCIVDLGTHWSFDYTGLKSWYSNDAFRNSFDHTAALSGGTQYEDWSFRLGHVYATSSAPLVETGRQTKQHTHVTSLFVGRALGSRAGVEVTAEQQLRSAEDAPSSHEWPVNAWFNYRIAPDLDVAVGLGGGFADIEPGANQLYRRPQARVSWRPRDTLTLRVSGGEEHRTFYGHTTSKLRRPVFDGAIEYRPTRTTRLTAHGGREVAVSYFTSQVSENTLQGYSLQQRLLGHFFLTASFEKQRMHYIGVDPLGRLLTELRDDSRRTSRIELSTAFLQRGSASVSYQHSKNDSSLPGYGFSSDQFAVELGVRY